MTVVLILAGFIGIGIISFAVGFKIGAHFGFEEGYEQGRNFECARWVVRMASPEDRRRIFGGNSHQSSQNYQCDEQIEEDV